MEELITQQLSQFTEIGDRIETFAIFTIAVTIAEVGVDFFANLKRNYRETFANFGVAIVYNIVENTIGNIVTVIPLFVISQLSFFKIPVTWWTWLLAILLADFTYYWMHRAEHRIRILWAHHSVHHSSCDFNLTTALRLSWFEVFLEWIFLIPMIILGFNLIQTIFSFAVVALYQHLIHTQKIGKLGILDRLLNTPSVHRVHHGSNSKYLDKNYGGILIIWDVLFGTYEPETKKVIYGLTENINTINPIKINSIEYLRIWHYIKKSKNSHEVFKSIFAPPEWQPKKIKQL
jgi:sterol desaturase/sphingolipid hydroxylase (fatty acid hydroxylase superfamily)